jgi:hypothetical protein
MKSNLKFVFFEKEIDEFFVQLLDPVEIVVDNHLRFNKNITIE